MAKSKAVFGPELKISTPPGIAVFPKLNEPDGTFDDPPIYSVGLRFEMHDEAWMKFIDTLNRFGEKVVKEIGGTLALSIGDDKDKEKVVSKTTKLFKAKLKSIRPGSGVAQAPAIYDAKLKLMVRKKVGIDDVVAPPIWGGSKLVLSVNITSCLVQGNAYCTANIMGVQVLDLVTGSAAAEPTFGMKPVEDGYGAVAHVTTAGEDDGDF